MPLSSETALPDNGSELTPLVTDEAREFLDGTITAEAYSEFVRRHAAREAGYDTPLRSFQHAAQTRVMAVLAVLAVSAYAIVGAVLSASKETGLTLIVAAGSGVASGAIVTVFYERLRRRR